MLSAPVGIDQEEGRTHIGSDMARIRSTNRYKRPPGKRKPVALEVREIVTAPDSKRRRASGITLSNQRRLDCSGYRSTVP
jgi:hypothetical protein